jgi:hypothetical protein
MSHLIEDRILETSTSVGTGVFALAAAVAGFRRFSAVCSIGDTFPYMIEALDSLGAPSGDYEYGVGTYSAANQLTRTTVLGSSNAGLAVNFAAGTKNVAISLNKTEVEARTRPGFRNRIINGNFLVNQRNASSASTAYAAGAYIMDRWKAGSGGATLSFANSGGVVTVTITAGSLVQVVEGNNLQSGTHVLSWTGTAQGKIGGGAYSATGVSAFFVGGSDATLEFNTGTLSLVQLEPGSVITPFEYRHYGAELALCQRYLPAFNAVGTTDDVGWGGTTSTSAALVGYQFLVEPRVPPTGITVSNVAHFSLTTMANLSTVTALAFSSASRRMCRMTVTGTATPYTANQPAILLAASASGQILFTGCEL